jgi:hypothetical protein
VDGLRGLDPVLTLECNSVREDFEADKSDCGGGTQEPFAESLILTPAVMRWPTGGVIYRFPKVRKLCAAALSVGISTRS